ncbi:hypothetical protein [Streptomyces sp. AM6-12]|uniref:hypothetical protein n=1 Tax=Streptomyces sp. AM6-12 TaxID=3345149 RepID=UPI0037B85664
MRYEGIRPRGRLPRFLTGLGLLGIGGCAALTLKQPETARQPLPTIDRPAASSRAPVRPDGSSLTDAQAQAALIGQSDLGAAWTATSGAATWRDGMLKASTSAGECQKLLDALYSDQLLGGPARVAVGLDDPGAGAQLRYQIGARRPSDVDATLDWLRTLPADCARFTAVTQQDAQEDVQVTELALPEVGDARQGLHITVSATTKDDQDVRLTLDVAAVRVGDDAFAFTNGGLGDAPNDATQAAVQVGALRLADVRRQGRAEV